MSGFNVELFAEELKLIQNVIVRMANNSALVKRWSISLIVASLILEKSIGYHFIAVLCVIVFWRLDAYYLCLERCYRELYNWVIVNRPNSNEYFFDLNAKERFECKIDSTWRIMCSDSCLFFYLAIFGIIIISAIDTFLL